MNPADLGVTADLDAFWATGSSRQLLLSAATLATAVALRALMLRAIRRGDALLTDGQRWWLSLVKNLIVVGALIALARIWAQELSEAALSLAAVAVAVVVATKELILCISGATWRGLARPFSVGDWIEIGPHSGEVIDESLLVTDLQEIDPHDFQITGRIVTVPNSLLLTQPVVNNGFRKRFLTFGFEIVSPPRPDGLELAERIAAAVAAASGEFCDVARRYAQRIERAAGARLRDPAPHVALDTNEYGNLVFRVTVFCPRDRAADLRAAAMAAFLAPARGGAPQGVAAAAAV